MKNFFVKIEDNGENTVIFNGKGTRVAEVYRHSPVDDEDTGYVEYLVSLGDKERVARFTYPQSGKNFMETTVSIKGIETVPVDLDGDSFYKELEALSPLGYKPMKRKGDSKRISRRILYRMVQDAKDEIQSIDWRCFDDEEFIDEMNSLLDEIKTRKCLNYASKYECVLGKAVQYGLEHGFMPKTRDVLRAIS